jgi:hypothetical protein
MNRSLTLTLTLGFLLLLSAAAYGQTFRWYPNYQAPHVVGGEVSAYGTVDRGTDFTVQHIGQGHYEVRFHKSIFPYGCPVMTVTAVNTVGSPPEGEVYQTSCSLSYEIFFSDPETGIFVDQAFDFVAVGTN